MGIKIENLDEVRKHIDRIDNVLINTLSERMSMMPIIARFKQGQGIPIIDEKRERQIMAKLLKFADEQGLNRGFVEEVFLSIFNEAKRIQSETINRRSDEANFKSGKNGK